MNNMRGSLNARILNKDCLNPLVAEILILEQLKENYVMYLDSLLCAAGIHAIV